MISMQAALLHDAAAIVCNSTAPTIPAPPLMACASSRNAASSLLDADLPHPRDALSDIVQAQGVELLQSFLAHRRCKLLINIFIQNVGS